MAKCECQHEKEITTIFNDIERWKSIIDGNGHEAIGTRIKVVEQNCKKMEQTIDNNLKSSEALKTSVSALFKTIEFENKQKEKESKKKNISFNNTFVVIMAALAILTFLFSIIKDFF